MVSIHLSKKVTQGNEVGRVTQKGDFKMLKKELSSDILQYIFPPRREGVHFGDNITAVIHENKAVLIDVGFEDEAKQVFEDLSEMGITIDKVIISHFHDDHMNGLKLLSDVPVYGSSHFQHALDMWVEKEEHKHFVPSVVVEQPMKIEFGNHTLEIIPSPGHSMCTVLVKINEQFLHVADEIMYSPDGQPLLPSIECRGDIKRQLESWDRIKDYQTLDIIPGHGATFEGNTLLQDLQNRSAFARTILKAESAITYEEAVKDCDCTFLHSNWFDHLAEG